MQVEENRRGGTRELDFYDLKGALEAAIDAMNLHPLRFTSAHVRHLREGQAARVMLDDGTAVGTIGKLDEAVAALYKFRQRVYVAEVDLTALLMSEQISARYQPLPRYPSIIRDVTVLVAPRVTLAELLKAVRAQKIDYCRDAKLVGVYEGENIPEGKRAVTLRIEYRADERTLRDEEVDEMHRQVVAALENTSKAG
jgi:phenylalanyl-tRNA synthetase beta chain